MEAQSRVEYLIVGQGLAGSLMAWELIRRGRSVCVVDDRDRSSASRVAAGIINPIVGQRLALNWQIDRLFPVAQELYGELESELKVSFFREVPAYRVFANDGERAQWITRSKDSTFATYGGPPLAPGHLGGWVNDPHGGFTMSGAAVLDTAVFLTVMQRWLADRGWFRKGRVPSAVLCDGDAPIEWSGIRADRIVHCDGYRAWTNPLLNQIPFQHAKGEILLARIPGLTETLIVGRSLYLLPLGQGLFRVGSTFDWEDVTPEITESARKMLEFRMHELLKIPFEIIDHQAGIRPVTRRRTPVLGVHPEFPHVAVFNGLGSKGVLTAPYYARQLADYLVGEAPLEKDVDISTHWTQAA